MIINVAIIDDNESILEMMRSYCQDTRETQLVYASTTAPEACQYLINHPGKVDLVFCDVMMPDMSGIELVRTVKETMGDSSPEFIIVTAYSHLGQADFSHALIDFLQKPVFPRGFKAAIQKTIDFFSAQGHYQITEKYVLDRMDSLVYVRKTDDACQFHFETGLIVGCTDLDHLQQVYPDLLQIHDDFYVNRRFFYTVESETVLTTRNDCLPTQDKFLKNLPR